MSDGLGQRDAGMDQGSTTVPLTLNALMACHDCDLLQRLPPLAMGVVAECPRCGAILRRTQFNSINRTIGWLIAGLILWRYPELRHLAFTDLESAEPEAVPPPITSFKS